MKIVTRSFLRYLPRRLSLSLLQLSGVACGVAAVVGMTLAARTALTSFTQAVEFLRGKATHSMQRPAGPMAEGLLTKLLQDSAVEWFSPVIDRRLRLSHGELVRLLGIDPFLDRTIRPELSRVQTPEKTSTHPESAFSFLLDDRSVLVDSDLAAELGLTVGQRIETLKGTLHVMGTFPNPSGEPLILMDIAHAQKFYGLQGQVDRIDLILSDESDFRSRWKDGFLIQSGLQRSGTFSAMLDAYRLNLEALSLLALFVGIFLIYNTAMFAVVSRRRDTGILRSLGAKRCEIVAAFLTEILILGVVGGAFGGLIGYFLTRFLTGLIGSSISNLYFFLRPEPPAWSSWILITGVFLGFAASLLGAAVPLVELIRTDPVKALSGRVASRENAREARKTAVAGLCVLAASFILLIPPKAHIYVSFAGIFGFVVGVSFLTGAVLVQLHPALKWILHRLGKLPGKVAAGNIRQNLGRTGVAIAAFMVALSMSIGLGAMIDSFRQSLIWWMDTQIRAELYVGKLDEAEVPEDFYDELRTLPGLGGVHPYRNVQVMYGDAPIYVSAVDASVLQRYAQFGWLRGGNENWEAVKRGGVILSESFSRRFGVRSGDTLVLQGIQGPAEFSVGAIFYDYTTEHGLVMMDRSTFLRVFGDRTINNVGIFIDPNNPRRVELLRQVKEKAQERGLPALTRAELHANILEVFDTTFAITRSMRAIAIVVAFFGIAGALLTFFMERRREFGIYRALGFSTGQVAKLTLLEGLGMGMVSYFLSLLVGTLLAVLLIKVINLRSFNWTIFFHPTFEPYVLTAVTAIVASIGAAVYPIWKVWRTYPHMQIREE
ncbi:MAG: FtsX-like permease family protein [Desulfobacterales bacterium]|nr:FtsX-like permease family protein [Desulfobacterales bacterium]